MKGRIVLLIILAVILADQALKIWVKTHYYYEENHAMLGKWFYLYFIENEGMAYGWKLGGNAGKLFLTLFRLAAVIFGGYYIITMIRRKYHTGLLVCAALIFAGAFGNLIDSMFYGIIYEKSTPSHISVLFPHEGYAGFLHGRVVDMLYFPIINTHYPLWFPVWGGQEFTFFSPIFNIADASISAGVIALILFQKKFFKDTDPDDGGTVETKAIVNDEVQVS
ncbi:lipoprotein signal peptidase [soil metagenome]